MKPSRSAFNYIHKNKLHIGIGELVLVRFISGFAQVADCMQTNPLSCRAHSFCSTKTGVF